jgi:hypothetical protein
MSAHEIGRKSGHDGLANPVVPDLDDLVSVAQPCANESVRAQRLQRVVDVLDDFGSGRRGGHSQRPPADRDDLGQCSRAPRQAVEPFANQLLEREQDQGGLRP